MLYPRLNRNPDEVAHLRRRKRGQDARRPRKNRKDRNGSPAQLSEEVDDRQTLEFDEDRTHMAVGFHVWDLDGSETPREVLSEYLAFVYSIQGLQPGTPVHVRHGDLKVLETAIGWPSDRISAYLVDLMLEQGFSRTVKTGSRVKEKTRDTMEDIVDWWNGKPGT